MGEHIVPIVVALLGLCGTIAGLVFAYRKWAQERRAEQSRSFREDRQKAYKEMWERVERLNVEGRIEEISNEEVSRRIADLNAFMMTSNVYIDDSERALVNAYTHAVRACREAVRSSGPAAGEVALGRTTDIPPEVLQQSQAILETQKEALGLRDSLLTKVRSVVSGSVVV